MTARAFWLGYAAALLAIVAACSGCATATVPSGPTAGARCLLDVAGRAVPVQVVGPAWGLVDVRGDAPHQVIMLVSPAALSSCRGAA